jgi:hypothetical protein
VITLRPVVFLAFTLGLAACSSGARAPRRADTTGSDARWCDGATCDEELGDLKVIVPQPLAASAQVPGR